MNQASNVIWASLLLPPRYSLPGDQSVGNPYIGSGQLDGERRTAGFLW